MTVGGTPLTVFSRSRLTPILAVALFVWLAFLVLSPRIYNQTRVFEPSFISDPLFLLPGTTGMQALFGIVALAFLAHILYHRHLTAATLVDWAIVAVVCAYVLATLFSIYPRFSLEALFLLGSVVLTYCVFRDLEELTLPMLVRGLAFVGVAGAVYALYRVGNDYASWLHLVSAVDGSLKAGDLLPPSVPRVHDVGDHVNMIALAFNLTLPFALVLGLTGRSQFERLSGVVGVLLIAIALFFTVSRSAWVAAAVSLPLFALLFHWRSASTLSPRVPRFPRPVWVIAAVMATVLVLGAALVIAARWDSRPEWLFRSSLSPRYDAAEAAIKIARDRPWTGSGPNTYGLLYNTYSGDYPIENIHPHNGYLAVAVDAGLLGVAAVAFLGVITLALLVRYYWKGTPEDRVLAAACLAALVALAVHALADTPNIWKTSLLPLAVVVALIVKANPVKGTRGLVPVLPRLIMVGFILAVFAGWLWTDRGHEAYNESLELLARGDFAAASQQALEAAARDPDFAVYQFHAGVTQAIDYLVRRDRGDDQPRLVEGAIASLRRGLDSEPRSAVGHANLALAYQLAGDPGQATAEARLAMARAPSDGTIAAVAGTIFEWAGEFGEAANAYSTAVTHDAALLQSPFWAATQFRHEARDSIVDGTFLSPCQKARVEALYSDNPDSLQELTLACSAALNGGGGARARSDLAVASLALGPQSLQVALHEAQAAVDQAGDDPYARTALGLVAEAQGDLEEARHQLMLGAYLGDPDAALLLYYTYNQPPAALANNLDLEYSFESTPKDVVDRLEAALPGSAAFVYDQGRQDYLLGILYYRPRFFRESPVSVLIPGDWLNLVSPRTLLIQQALEDAGRR